MLTTKLVFRWALNIISLKKGWGFFWGAIFGVWLVDVVWKVSHHSRAKGSVSITANFPRKVVPSNRQEE